MSLPEWPATLPQYPRREGLSFEIVDNIARAPTDTGPGKQRPRSRSEYVRVQCSTKVATRAELETLLAFHRDTLIQGALRFTWTGLTDNIPNGTYEALQFAAKPQWRPAGATAWLVTMELLAIPAAPPIRLIEQERLSGFVTLTRPETLDYYDADGNLQTAAVDEPAYDYHPTRLTYRGLKLGDADNVSLSVDYVAEGVGTLTIGHEPMVTADHTVLTLDDGSTANQVQLAIDATGEYVFSVRSGGAEVASLATGVFAEQLVRKTFMLTWGEDTFRALGSGGSVVSDTAGAAPAALTGFSLGNQAWIQPLHYEARTYTAAQMSVPAAKAFGTGVLVDDVSVAETGTELVFTIRRVGDTSGTSSVDFSTADGTATANEDYTPVSDTADFDAGQTTYDVHVPIADDLVYEGDETLSLNLSTPVDCEILDATAIGTIVEDEAPPVVSIEQSSYTFDEDAGTVNLKLIKTGDTAVPCSVDWAFNDGPDAGDADAGTDYTAANGTETFAAGETEKIVQLQILDRGYDYQGSRDLTLDLSGASDCTLGTAQATITIRDKAVPLIANGAPTAQTTFTRNSIGTRWDSAGNLAEAAVDVARTDYDPVTLAVRGMLVERQGTTFVGKPNDLTDTNIWIRDGLSVNTYADPKFPSAFELVVPDDGQTVHRRAYQSLNTGQKNFVSVAFKKNNWRYVFLSTGNPTYRRTTVDLDTGTIVNTQSPNADTPPTITDIGDSWYLVTYKSDATAGQYDDIAFGFFQDATTPQVVGSGSKSVYVAAPMAQAGADFLSSYISHSGAGSATRADDIAIASIGGIWPSVYSREIVATAGYDRDAVLWQDDDGTENNRVRLARVAGNLHLIVTAGGVEQCDLDLGAVADLAEFTVRYRIGANDVAASLNSAPVVTDNTVTMPSGLAHRREGADASGTYWNGWIKDATDYGRGLTDAELAA